MKLYKNIALASFLLLPMTAQASGIGLYVPMAASTSSSTEDNDINYTEDLVYKPGYGIGLVYDSNVGKDDMYAYRLGLEYLKMDIDTINGNTYNGDEKFTRFNMVNTFEFGLVTTKSIRFWAGPRINIAYQSYSYQSGTYSFDQSNVEFGIAPALGTNFNLGSIVSLGFDVDYRFTGLSGAWTAKDSQISLDDDGSYSGTGKGLTARLYLLFRFGEGHSDAVAPTNNTNTNNTPSYQHNDDVIDDSL